MWAVAIAYVAYTILLWSVPFALSFVRPSTKCLAAPFRLEIKCIVYTDCIYVRRHTWPSSEPEITGIVREDIRNFVSYFHQCFNETLPCCRRFPENCFYAFQWNYEYEYHSHRQMWVEIERIYGKHICSMVDERWPNYCRRKSDILTLFQIDDVCTVYTVHTPECSKPLTEWRCDSKNESFICILKPYLLNIDPFAPLLSLNALCSFV